MSGVRLSGLYFYPVKSLRGVAADSVEVDSLGIVGDRRFMVVDESGRFLTQRTLPCMATVKASIGPAGLELSKDNFCGIRVSIAASGDVGRSLGKVTVWNDENLAAEDCGDEPAAWLSQVLGIKCRLARIGREFSRPIPPHKLAGMPGNPNSGATSSHFMSFADAFPFLILGEASLDDLNQRLGSIGEQALPMNRFRPNLVIAGSAPYAEDGWKRIRIGKLVFSVGGPCARCAITTTDQMTGDRGVEPLRMLSIYRRDPAQPTKVNFGQNLIHETKSGTLAIGDQVEVLE
jgi:uncharacterized protein YcbX